MIINTEADYQRSKKLVAHSEKGFIQQRERLVKEGLSPQEIERAMEPTMSFLEDIKDEVKWYENAKKKKFSPMTELTGIGRMLIALRISSGMSQTEFAERMDVAQSQISRDENEEYQGITLERAQKILAIFGARLESKVVLTSSHHGIPNRRKAA